MAERRDGIITMGVKMAFASIIAKIIKIAIIGILIFGVVFFLIDYSTTDSIDKYIAASKSIRQGEYTYSKEQFKQSYLTITNSESDIYSGTRDEEKKEEEEGSNVSSGTPSYSIDFVAIQNSEMYKLFSSSKTYSAKALAYTLAYNRIMQEYGSQNFALGLMANIMAEGNIGQIEGIARYADQKYDSKGNPKYMQITCNHGNVSRGNYTNKYWMTIPDDIREEVHAVALKNVVGHKEYITTLRKLPKAHSGIGVGMVQWSGGRRDSLLDLYETQCPSMSFEEVASAEVNFYIYEFNNNPRFTSVRDDCIAAKTPSEAAAILTMRYEVPVSASVKAVQRGSAAEAMKQFLVDGGVIK